MEVKKDSLSFPILWIQLFDNSMGIFKDFNELTSCGRGSESFFKNLLIILPEGRKYTIIEAIKLGKARPITGIEFLKYFGLYEIKVKLDFSDKVGSIRLETLKEMVLNILNKDEEIWDSDGRLSLLKRKIEFAKSVNEIVITIKKRYFHEAFD